MVQKMALPLQGPGVLLEAVTEEQRAAVWAGLAP